MLIEPVKVWVTLPCFWWQLGHFRTDSTSWQREREREKGGREDLKWFNHLVLLETMDIVVRVFSQNVIEPVHWCISLI